MAAVQRKGGHDGNWHGIPGAVAATAGLLCITLARSRRISEDDLEMDQPGHIPESGTDDWVPMPAGRRLSHV